MDNLYLYYADLPPAIREYVCPCYDGYTIYVNDRLSREEKEKAYNHAIAHIVGNDFSCYDVQSIEGRRHL